MTKVRGLSPLEVQKFKPKTGPHKPPVAQTMETKGLVVVAVGLPGAGKSRFHEKFLPDAVRCCQDLLKRREKVESLVEETVRAGGIAYVDRTDLDPKQRSHWVKIAKALQRRGRRVTVHRDRLHFERAKARAEKGEHDGELNNPDKVAGLIGIMKNRKKQKRLARQRDA